MSDGDQPGRAGSRRHPKPLVPAGVWIGAIHCLVFGGFASGSLASRIEDATPKVIASSDAGSRGGKVVPYKPLLDEALRLAARKPDAVLLCDRCLAAMDLMAERDHLAADMAAKARRRSALHVVDATDFGYTIYTSGTTAKPKGVQRRYAERALCCRSPTRSIGVRPKRRLVDAHWRLGETASTGLRERA